MPQPRDEIHGLNGYEGIDDEDTTIQEPIKWDQEAKDLAKQDPRKTGGTRCLEFEGGASTTSSRSRVYVSPTGDFPYDFDESPYQR